MKSEHIAPHEASGRGRDRLLLGPKLAWSPPSPYEVARPQLCDLIFSAGGAKLVLIRAAAGFGKTTLMRQVRQRCENSGLDSTWLNLDAADNDVGRFLAALSAAIRKVIPGALPDEAGTPFDADGGGAFALELLDRIATHQKPFVLFMDEFEALQSPTVLSLVRQLINNLPVGAQLVIGSRTIPALGLGQMRARGWLFDIEPEQLRFTVGEVTEFLCTNQHLALSAADVKNLHQRTEGWPAALWLASLALDKHKNASVFLESFSGSDTAIADYLAEDVLAQQPEDLRNFLLRTSILGVFNAALCDAVCGRDDSRELLARLEQANLFLIPLDNKRESYRYYSLFAEFLRTRLAYEFPGEVRRLHLAAAEWYRTQERAIPAIEHAMASGDFDYVLPLLAAHASQLLMDARMRLLARWLGALPPHRLDAYPQLRIVHAWALSFTRGPREAMAMLETLNTADAAPVLDDDSAAQSASLRPLLLSLMDRHEEAGELARVNLSALPAGAGFARSMLANTLVTVELVAGRFSAAQQFLEEARRSQAPFGVTLSIALSDGLEGSMDMLRGHLRQAIVRLRAATRPGSQDISGYSKVNALAGILLAEALYEADECEQAERLLGVYVPFIKECGQADQIISGHVLLARIAASRGDVDYAYQLLTEQEHIGRRLDLRRVVASAKLERARLLLAQGNVDAAAEELYAANDATVWERVGRLFLVANDAETLEIGKLRWMVCSGQATAALPLLDVQLQAAEREQRKRRALKLRILTAEALHRLGRLRAALAAIEQALVVAAEEGYVRTFLDEGESVAALIQEWGAAHAAAGKPAIAAEYVKRILAATTKTGAEDEADAADAPPGPAATLTRKELQVLRMLAEGLSNRALAERMFVSETTIRTHLRNINSKLGVHNRVSALAVARREGYID